MVFNDIYGGVKPCQPPPPLAYQTLVSHLMFINVHLPLAYMLSARDMKLRRICGKFSNISPPGGLHLFV